MQNVRLDAGAAALLARLHGAGYAAYAVGGCVRDSLLGRTPQDWDLCTSARPEQVLALFGEGQCIPTGLQHGTVTIKYGGQLYETTTFRTEGAYTDGRHPDEVHFVPDVRQDLARRDFTINAMAYNDAEGLIDPFGGQQDLQQGILRAVGDPATRFEEDALRILRLYRFAARFGFAIDPPTGQAARALCAHLDCVSVERIEEELSKLLAAPAPAAYLDEKILKVIIPELSAPALQAAKPVVDACPAGTEDLPVRWAALLMSLGEDGTRKVLKRLRCSNALIEETAVLVRGMGGSGGRFLLGHEKGHSIALPTACGSRVPPQRTVLGETSTAPGQAPAAHDTVIRIRKLLGRYDLHTVQRLAALGAAMEPEQAADFAAQAELAAQLDADGVCCRVSQLAVNGRDLMAAGIPAGPGLRRTLEALLDAVIRGQLPNERQCLLDAAGQISAS
jgi:tRNA nucleotidyltransferase (CCA-adding enzyme)